ncbi:hypothetical protein D3C81_1829560 [compost metagenome]
MGTNNANQRLRVHQPDDAVCAHDVAVRERSCFFHDHRVLILFGECLQRRNRFPIPYRQPLQIIARQLLEPLLLSLLRNPVLLIGLQCTFTVHLHEAAKIADKQLPGLLKFIIHCIATLLFYLSQVLNRLPHASAWIL